MDLRLIPDDWPLADQLLPLAAAAARRLDLEDRLRSLTLVIDALAADDRSWLTLGGGPQQRRLTLYLHPDQVLRDRPGHGAARRDDVDWSQGPAPAADAAPSPDDFSAPNAQRFLYQQLQLVDDLMAPRLDPAQVPAALLEAFQEAWLTTIDGRLQREGLPHLSEGERRMRFLRLFSPAGVLTPRHWAIFNALWTGEAADQDAVLARVRALPPLRRRLLP